MSRYFYIQFRQGVLFSFHPRTRLAYACSRPKHHKGLGMRQGKLLDIEQCVICTPESTLRKSFSKLNIELWRIWYQNVSKKMICFCFYLFCLFYCYFTHLYLFYFTWFHVFFLLLFFFFLSHPHVDKTRFEKAISSILGLRYDGTDSLSRCSCITH